MIISAEPSPPLSVSLVNGETKRDEDLELLPGHDFVSLLSAQGEDKDSNLRSSCSWMKSCPRSKHPFASHGLESRSQQNSQVHLGTGSFLMAEGEPELITPLQALGRNGYFQKTVDSIVGYISKIGQTSFSSEASVAIKSSHLAQMSVPNF